jgi:UDP-GlcNAc:undecaprenyl-phosphate GlcNAc-1-phosphate transferase
MEMIYLSALVLSMFTTIALMPMLKDFSAKYMVLDMPGGRKIHERPVPKCGGIAMILGALVPVLLWSQDGVFIRSILIGSWIIILFGLIDDIKDLPYGIKFFGQLAAALVVIYYGGLKIKNIGDLLLNVSPLPDFAAVPLTVVVIVGVTNAINLSDGLDGLAGGISLLVFICIGYLGFLDGSTGVVIVCTTMIGAILGFLRFNTHPASIFMGDAGSQLLGFLAVTLSLSLTQNNVELSPVLPLLIMGLPIMDTLRVMGERILEGKKPFVADTRHLHHRLLKLGLFHTEAVLAIYFLHAALVTFAFIFRYHSDKFLLLMYIVPSAVIISSLVGIERIGWHRKKYDFLDGFLKSRLRSLKYSHVLIKIFFKLLEFGAPLLLLVACLTSMTIPFLLSLIATVFFCILIAVQLFKPQWTGLALRMVIYIQVPNIIYQSEINSGTWVNVPLMQGYNILFAIAALIVLLVLKFTRRKTGFKSTPMDFLILFVALVIPNIPDAQIRSYQMGMIAAKIICIYFAYEVLIGEFRGDYKRMSYVTGLILLIICGRGFLGV